MEAKQKLHDMHLSAREKRAKDQMPRNLRHLSCPEYNLQFL